MWNQHGVPDQTELRGKKFGTQFVSPLELQNLDSRKHIFNKESNVRFVYYTGTQYLESCFQDLNYTPLMKC